jgi:Flp pilus assembly pilin Flp
MNLLRALWQDEEGQDLAEYGIALAVIAGGVASAVVLLSGEIGQLWGTAAKSIRQALASGGS